jgi:hypothetical protein
VAAIALFFDEFRKKYSDVDILCAETEAMKR